MFDGSFEQLRKDTGMIRCPVTKTNVFGSIVIGFILFECIVAEDIVFQCRVILIESFVIDDWIDYVCIACGFASTFGELSSCCCNV